MSSTLVSRPPCRRFVSIVAVTLRVALAVLLDDFLGVGEVSGHVILHRLQNTNDLAVPKCVIDQMRSEPQKN